MIKAFNLNPNGIPNFFNSLELLKYVSGDTQDKIIPSKFLFLINGDISLIFSPLGSLFPSDM